MSALPEVSPERLAALRRRGPRPQARLTFAFACALATLGGGAAMPAWRVLEDDPESATISCPPIRHRPLWRLLDQAPWLAEEAFAAGRPALALDFYRPDLYQF